MTEVRRLEPELYDVYPSYVSELFMKNKKFTYTREEAAIILGVSASSISKFYQEAAFKIGTGKNKNKKLYYMPKLLQVFREKIESRLASSVLIKKKEQLEQEAKGEIENLNKKIDAFVSKDIDEEKLKLVVAQTKESKQRERKLKIENDLREKKTLDALEVEKATVKVFSEIKKKLDGFPSASAQSLLACETYKEVHDLLTEKMFWVCTELVKQIGYKRDES